MNFDTYIVSLTNNPDRREHMVNVMSKVNIPYQFFDAIAAHDVTDEMANTMFKNYDYQEQPHINHKAVMATFLSHMSLLRVSHLTKRNLLILEDDIDITDGVQIDYNNIDFKEFDVFNLGTLIGCYSYFISWEGAGKILEVIEQEGISRAYDWELCGWGLNGKFRYHYLPYPNWYQTNGFISNIAPNGYK